MANLWLPLFDPSREFFARRDRLLWKGQRYNAGDKFQKRHATIRQLQMLYDQRMIGYPDQPQNRMSERSLSPERLRAKAEAILGVGEPQPAPATQEPVEVAPEGDGVKEMVEANTKAQLLETAQSAGLDAKPAMNKDQLAKLILESRDGAS